MEGDTQSFAVETAASPRAQLMAFVRSPRGRMILAGLAALVLLVLVARFLVDRAAYVSTSDARIAAEMIAVSTDISGKITSVQVKEGDRVAAGDILYTIDDREAYYALVQLEAEARRLRAEIEREERRVGIASSKAGSEVAARKAGTLSAAASVEAARSNVEIAQRDYDRTRDLFERGLLPQSNLDQAKNVLDTAEQALRRAQADRESAAADQRTASIAGEEVRLIDYDLTVLRAALEQAEARVDAQKVVLEQHTIRSPIDGVVDELFFDNGEHSLRGYRMALLHDPDAVWVSANIKETDIRHVQANAPVLVRADSDPSHQIEGRVTRVHDATIAEAAMMPNPNANGVFTKITQRIRIRIDLDPTEAELRPGTMVRVRVKKEPAGGAPE
ncbi:HlyD family secretion protein [Hyphomonas sp. WL0036]|uniref:HlyD family secretion protein n=1 Tax=Hyphomonas sediminis TaxID=2866160 RepID=UPI001C820A00|nr:HlyD family secretion protein [Hyphomonas sediminis]MBY9068066.1 HlyD family secretion protein [Hyphomonas sediminis]